MVSSLIRSLPDDDPRRHLAAYCEPLVPLIDCAGGRRSGADATTMHGAFGSKPDMLDLRVSELRGAQSELGLAAVAVTISDRASPSDWRR